MPQIAPITLTGNSVDSLFNYVGQKGDVHSFRFIPVTGLATEAQYLTTSNVENPSLQRTRISFKLKEPVTHTIDGVVNTYGDNEVDISFRLSHFSTEAQRLAFREKVVDLLSEVKVAAQVENLESWY